MKGKTTTTVELQLGPQKANSHGSGMPIRQKRTSLSTVKQATLVQISAVHQLVPHPLPFHTTTHPLFPTPSSPLSMSERKVLNKYFPPDFDPALIPRRKQPKDLQHKVRLMTPFSMRCNTCGEGEYIYKGKKRSSTPGRRRPTKLITPSRSTDSISVATVVLPRSPSRLTCKFRLCGREWRPEKL